MSETKETEAGAEAQSEGTEAAQAATDETADASGAPALDAEASEATLKKKKKRAARDEGEPEAKILRPLFPLRLNNTGMVFPACTHAPEAGAARRPKKPLKL